MDEIAQIGLVHTTGLAARLIQSVTGSHWNHVIIRTTRTRCIGAQPGGVRERLVSDFPETVWSAFEYTSHQQDRIVEYVRAQIGKPYNWVDDILIGIALRIRRTSAPTWLVREVSTRTSWQCSQLADAALMAAGVHVFNDRRPSGAVYPASFVPLYVDAGWLTDKDPR